MLRAFTTYSAEMYIGVSASGGVPLQVFFAFYLLSEIDSDAILSCFMLARLPYVKGL